MTQGYNSLVLFKVVYINVDDLRSFVLDNCRSHQLREMTFISFKDRDER